MSVSLNCLIFCAFIFSINAFSTDVLTQFHFKPKLEGSLVPLKELIGQVYPVKVYSEKMVFGNDFSPNQWVIKRSCDFKLNEKYHFHLLALKKTYDLDLIDFIKSQGIFYENLIHYLNLYQETEMSIESYKFFVKSIDSLRKSYSYMMTNLSKIDYMDDSFKNYHHSFCHSGKKSLKKESFYYNLKELLRKAKLVLSFVLEDIAKNKKISRYLILNLFVYYESFDELYFHQYDLLKNFDSSNPFKLEK